MPVNLSTEILTWSEKLRPWQRDLLRRLSIGETLTIEDTRSYAAGALADVQVQEKKAAWFSQPSPADINTRVAPLEAHHLRIEASPNVPGLVITQIDHGDGANALARGASLSFETGLTIIAGRNGSGKSGYSRILKQVAATRGPEPVHPNAFAASGSPAATATIRFRDGNSEPVDHVWVSGEDAFSPLRRVRVFDTKSAAAQVSTSNEVAYVPPLLSMLSEYNAALDRVKVELALELSIERAAVRDFPNLATAHLVPIFATLGSVACRAAIVAEGTLSEDELAELAALPAAIQIAASSDPARLSVEARGRAGHYTKAALALNAISKALDPTKLMDLADAIESAASAQLLLDLEDARGERAHLLSKAEWHSLWNAADDFAQTLGSHVEDFEDDDGVARCVLCLQELDANSVERFHEIAKKAKGDLRKSLATAQRLQTTRQEALSAVRIENAVPADVLTLFAFRDPATTALIGPILTEAESVRAAAGGRDLGTRDIHLRLCGIAEKLNKAAAEEEETADKYGEVDHSAGKAKELQSRFDSLTLRVAFREDLEAVRAAHDRAIRIDQIAKASRKCETTSASRLSGKLSQDYVERVAEVFAKESKALGLAKVPVQLVFDKNSRGTTYIKIALRGAPKVSAASVLSEGEQRVAALAGFFADLADGGDSSTLVFDDPVSSLDQDFRRFVARRLLMESTHRQVLVFTHDNVFVHHIYEQERLLALESRSTGCEPQQELAYVHIARQSGGTGLKTDEDQWRHSSLRERISRIRDRAQRAGALYRASDFVQYDAVARSIVGALRETWEALVEQLLLDGIVLRHERGVHTQKLRNITDLTDQDVATVELGMTVESRFMTGHDAPLSDDASVGDPEFLEAEIARIVGFKTLVERRRK